MNKNLMIGLAVLILAIGGYYLFTKPTTAPAPSPSPTDTMTASPSTDLMTDDDEDTMTEEGVTKVTFDLDEQNNSSESGTATLREVDSKVLVSLVLTGAPEGVPQPAHIHLNTCANIGSVKYPLTSVVNGRSETTIDVTLEDLAAQMPLSLNVHKSAAESNVYVACGNLPL